MYLLVADDLTGGNDAGIQFVKNGLEAWIALSPECFTLSSNANGKVTGPDMVVVNTNTRNLPLEEAAMRVAGLMANLVKNPVFSRPEIVFKKIDSTLRGNIGAETDALMHGLGFRAAFLTPAYPGQGRVVKDGNLFVNGIPAHEAGFSADPLSPIHESKVASIVSRQSSRVISEIPLPVVREGLETLYAAVAGKIREGAEILVFDAETPEHLRAIAEAGLAMHDVPLFIGSAGLAEALAGLIPRTEKPPHGQAGTAEHIFFICGSAHQATRIQTERLVSTGVPAVRFSDAFSATASGPKEQQSTVVSLATALENGDVILASPAAGGEASPGNGKELSESMGETALAAIEKSGIRSSSLALVMTGGETAYAVLKEACRGLALEKELFPGIVLCRVLGGRWDSLRVVTKAGAFGNPDTMVDIVRALRPGTHGQ